MGLDFIVCEKFLSMKTQDHELLSKFKIFGGSQWAHIDSNKTLEEKARCELHKLELHAVLNKSWK